MKWNLSLILLLLSFSPVTTAYTAYGHGASSSCGEWVEERRKGGDGSTVLERYMRTWVSGFLSGAGYQGAKIKEVDSSAVAIWIDNYCQNNPLSKLAHAAEALVQELVKP